MVLTDAVSRRTGIELYPEVPLDRVLGIACFDIELSVALTGKAVLTPEYDMGRAGLDLSDCLLVESDEREVIEVE